MQNPSPHALSGAIANRAMNARSQAAHVVLDARSQLGMTADIAVGGIRRAFGADNATAANDGSPPRLASVRVIIRSGPSVDSDLFVPRDEANP